MKSTIVKQFGPGKDNPRNSEGAFLRLDNGDILYAYSHYCGESCHDHAACNIWMTRSSDEGDTWSEPKEIVNASFYGVKNIMSVSAMRLLDGRYCFYFLSKEADMATKIRRAVSVDGENFTPEVCDCTYPNAYYVTNNDRFVRLKSGQVVAPSAYYTLKAIRRYEIERPRARTTAMLSDDDGKTWYRADFMLDTHSKSGGNRGLQEPGIIERENDIYLYMRTGYGCQYQSISTTGMNGFETFEPSDFTAPGSPMLIKEFDGVMYAIYNPIPRYNGIFEYEGTWGRTPMVIRKSTDGGNTWGPLNVLASEKERGYSYPAMIKTNDGHLLVGMCMGNASDGNNLCRLGIFKVDISTIE